MFLCVLLSHTSYLYVFLVPNPMIREQLVCLCLPQTPSSFLGSSRTRPDFRLPSTSTHSTHFTCTSSHIPTHCIRLGFPCINISSPLGFLASASSRAHDPHYRLPAPHQMRLYLDFLSPWLVFPAQSRPSWTAWSLPLLILPLPLLLSLAYLLFTPGDTRLARRALLPVALFGILPMGFSHHFHGEHQFSGETKPLPP